MGKVGNFFGLSKIEAKLCILQEKLRSYQDASFPSFQSLLRRFLAEYHEKKKRSKTLNLRKSAKPLKYLLKMAKKEPY